MIGGLQFHPESRWCTQHTVPADTTFRTVHGFEVFCPMHNPLPYPLWNLFLMYCPLDSPQFIAIQRHSDCPVYSAILWRNPEQSSAELSCGTGTHRKKNYFSFTVYIISPPTGIVNSFYKYFKNKLYKIFKFIFLLTSPSQKGTMST